MQNEMPGRLGHGVLDERPRENQPPFRSELRARLGHVFDTARSRVRKTDTFEHVERGMMDAQHIGVG